MSLSRRALLGTAAGAAVAVYRFGEASAQPGSQPTIRLGILSDQSGPYSSVTGATSVACVRQAIEDFNPSARGVAVEVLVGDHQNKADVGSQIARQWIDRD